MTKWEYHLETIVLQADGQVETYSTDPKGVLMNPLVYLNFLGAQGWELINFGTVGQYIEILLKRPMVSP